METTLDAKTIEALAKAIARAQLTAADEFVNENIAAWPDESRRKVGEIGAPMNSNGDTLTSAQRLERFRQIRPQAEAAIERAKVQAIETAKQNEANRARREADQSAQIAANQAYYDADVARHKADVIIAQQSGRTEPLAPNPENYALTPDGLARESMRHRMKENF
jgi:hypothetical protein